MKQIACGQLEISLRQIFLPLSLSPCINISSGLLDGWVAGDIFPLPRSKRPNPLHTHPHEIMDSLKINPDVSPFHVLFDKLNKAPYFFQNHYLAQKIYSHVCHPFQPALFKWQWFHRLKWKDTSSLVPSLLLLFFFFFERASAIGRLNNGNMQKEKLHANSLWR